MSDTKHSAKDNNKNIGRINHCNEFSKNLNPSPEVCKQALNTIENKFSQDKSIKGSSRKQSLVIEDKKSNFDDTSNNSKIMKNDFENKSKEDNDKKYPSEIFNHNLKENNEKNFEKFNEDEKKNLKNEIMKIRENYSSINNASFKMNNNSRNYNAFNIEYEKYPNYNFDNISNVNNVNVNTNSTFNINYYNNKFENLAQKNTAMNNYNFNFHKKKDFNLTYGEVVRIFKIFKIIAEGEKQVEIVRQVLSEISRFDPFATFKYFDLDCKNFLTKNDFQNYLKRNKIAYETDHIKMIVSSYDADHDDRLTYSDFINMVVTSKDPILKQLAIKFSKTSMLKEIDYNFNTKLADSIENNLIKFFLREIDLFRNLNNFIKEIRNDYNEITFISKLFSEFDFENRNFFKEDHLNFFFQVCERNFDLRNLKINFCASDIKGIFNRLDINKDGKIHYWELKNFFKFRDYSKISGLEDIEYRTGHSQYAYQTSAIPSKTDNFNNLNSNNDNEKGLLEHKYPSKYNLNSNYKNLNVNKANLDETSKDIMRSPSYNSNFFNFNEIHSEIEEKIGNINKLIKHDKSKQSQLDNQIRFITEADNVKRFIGNEIEKVNNPNIKQIEIISDNVYPKEQFGQGKASCNPNLTRKYLSNNNDANCNNNLNVNHFDSNQKNNKNNINYSYSKNNSRKPSENYVHLNSPENQNKGKAITNLNNLSIEKHNKSKQFSSSKFGFSTFEETKVNNTYGIKLNLEEEIFLQFLVDIIQLNNETESIKNDLARRFDFSILKLFKVFQSLENENEVFQEEKNSFKPNYTSPIGEYRERSNYPNTFNITNKFNNTNNSFCSNLNMSENKHQQNQSFNLSYMKSFPIGRKNKENFISRFAFKKMLNEMDIYPTLIELKLILNRFNNKEADFSFANFCFMFLPFDEAYRKIMNIQNNYNFSYNLENEVNSCHHFSPETEQNLIELLRKLISNENKIEIWRVKLSKMQMFSVKNIFTKMIDNRMPDSNYAFITKMDLGYYLNHIFNITYRSIDIKDHVDMIIQIFDKDKDGKISFNEFVDEIFPQVSEIN